MPDLDCETIREQLAAYPDNKLGFVVYRLTYKDDAAWARFMDWLNTRVQKILKDEGEGSLFAHIDWTVQEDPQLEGASTSQVRSRFLEWVQQDTSTRKAKYEPDPRRRACLAVNQRHVDRAMRDMDRADPEDDEEAYVDLISIDEEEEYTSVALRAIFPRAFSLLAGLGWEGLGAGPEDVFDD